MKKLICIVLALSMLFAFAGCAGNNGGGKDEPAAKTVADDRNLIEMTITAPETYASVERFTGRKPDGTLEEKNLIYTLEDDREISYAVMTGQQLAELIDLSNFEQKEIAGQQYYTVERNGDFYAFAQQENNLYAVAYQPAEGEEFTKLEAMLEGVTFGEAAETETDDAEMTGVTYAFDEALTPAGTSVRVTASPDGTVTQKTVIWKFGEDADKPDFGLYLCVYKNQLLEDVLKEDKEYETATVGELEYTVLKTDDEVPYEYYIQQGDDVYEVRNNGDTSGWFVSRTEESEVAFEAFLASIRFE